MTKAMTRRPRRVLDDLLRGRAGWLKPRGPEPFRDAPFRAELAPEECRGIPETPQVERTGHFGLLAAPLLVASLAVAGAAAFGPLRGRPGEGIRVAEGATVGAHDAEALGVAELPKIGRVRARHDDSGALAALEAEVSLGAVQGRVGLEKPLEVARSRRLVLARWEALEARFREGTAGGARRWAVRLEIVDRDYRGGARLADGRELLFRTTVRDGEIGAMDVRVMSGGVLQGISEIEPGRPLALGAGETLELEGVARMIELAVEREVGRLWLAIAALLAGLGAVLYVGVVPVDSAVWGEGGRLVIAVRPHRFPRRFAGRLERLKKEWIR